MTTWDRIFNPAEPAQPSEPDNVYRWGTVVDVLPLQVRLDGDTAPLASTPDTLVGDLYPGARVWCQIYRRRVIVVGRSRGSAPVAAASYYIMGMGYSAGVPYYDTSNIVYAAGAATTVPEGTFCKSVPLTNASRLQILKSGWYSITAWLTMQLTAGNPGRKYVSMYVYNSVSTPTSGWVAQYRASAATDEALMFIGLPKLWLAEGQALSIGCYAQAYTYNLPSSSNWLTIAKEG